MLTAKKFVIPCLAAILALGVLPAAADHEAANAETAEKSAKKRSGCAFRRMINGFSVIDDEHFVLESGMREFLVTLSPGCHHLDFEMRIAIKSLPFAGMCVERGDRVILNNHFTCLIREIEPVADKKEAKKIVQERKNADEDSEEIDRY